MTMSWIRPASPRRHFTALVNITPFTEFPFGEFSTSAPCLRMVSSPPYSRSPAIRPGWRVLRQQLTLLGSPAFGTSAPCLRMVSSPSVLGPRCERHSHLSPNCRSCSLVLRLCAYAQSPHHLIPVHPPSVYPPSWPYPLKWTHFF